MDSHEKSVNVFTSEDRFFSAIGRFIFEFSQLEYSLRFYIAEGINITTDQHFNAIMTHDFSRLCDVAGNVLVPLVDETQSNRLKKLISKCKALNDERVRIVHGLWFVSSKEGRLIHASRGQIQAKVYFEKHIEVATLADRATEYRFELGQIYYYTRPVNRPPNPERL
jgi:hypothetical protein